jgi:hypothetical protein
VLALMIWLLYNSSGDKLEKYVFMQLQIVIYEQLYILEVFLQGVYIYICFNFINLYFSEGLFLVYSRKKLPSLKIIAQLICRKSMKLRSWRFAWQQVIKYLWLRKKGINGRCDIKHTHTRTQYIKKKSTQFKILSTGVKG